MKTKCLFYIEGLNCDLFGIKVTIKSLREYYKDDITVLYQNIDKILLDFLFSQNVNCINCSDYSVKFKTSPYNNKVLYSFLYLKKESHVIKDHLILLCDISDVLFKCNPFELYTGKMTLFLEDKPFTNCECNSTWIRICYNNEVLSRIENEIVINAGLYLSSYNSLFKFFELIINDMAKIFAKINYPIVEQAIVNKLIYFDGVECYLDSINVNNMAQQVKIKANNKINHQYKVFPKLKKELYAIYAE